MFASLCWFYLDWLKATQAFVVLATLAGISGTFAAMSFSLLPRLHGIQYFGITAVALSLATGINELITSRVNVSLNGFMESHKYLKKEKKKKRRIRST